MEDDLIHRLREQAAEIAQEGHAGWGNTMTSAAEEIERLRADIYALRDELSAWVAERDALKARIEGAPVAIMDTRHALGLCAPTEEDFPALYALQGKRVALVVIGDG